LWLVSIVGLIKADGIRTDNSTDKRLLQQRLRIRANKIAVIPVPPNSSVQKKLLAVRTNSAMKTKNRSGHPVILSIGTLTSNKGFCDLLFSVHTVIPLFPTLEVIIIGSGPLKQELIQLIDHLQLQKVVRMLPAVPYNNLLSYYARADLFVLASHLEGLPRVLMEASLAGCPVVTTNINGAKDLIIYQKTGLIVPIRNSDKLAQAITYALKNPKAMQSMAHVAQQKAKTYLDFNTNVRAQVIFWSGLINSLTN
jgi:glycosyltransferase involved in cell wall biosynthesis